MERQKTYSSQCDTKEEQSWKTQLPNIKTYYKATLIKTSWHWLKNRHLYQWDRVENPETNLHRYSQLIFFNRKAIAIQWGKDNLFNKWFWNCWMSICTHTETPNVKCKIVKLCSNFQKKSDRKAYVTLNWWIFRYNTTVWSMKEEKNS